MRLLLALAVTSAFAATALGQTASPAEPPYVGTFLAVNSTEANANTREMTRETPNHRVRARGLGIGGGESYLELSGPTCPTRLARGEHLEFVVRVSPSSIEQAIDPHDLIEFFSLRTLGPIRRLQLVNVGFVGLRSRATANEAAVAFNAERYGASSYSLVPRDPLPPGEYMLRLGEDHDSFCFGVDP